MISGAFFSFFALDASCQDFYDSIPRKRTAPDEVVVPFSSRFEGYGKPCDTERLNGAKPTAHTGSGIRLFVGRWNFYKKLLSYLFGETT